MDQLLSMKFVFLSESLRELAYEQLTFSIRRMLHKKIAEWYEYTYSKSENSSSHAFVLAKHWERGACIEKALECYFNAAMFANRIWDPDAMLNSSRKARMLLLAGSDIDDLGDAKRVMLCRIDFAIFECRYRGHIKEVEERKQADLNCRSAVLYLTGYDLAGGLCAQLALIARFATLMLSS